MNPLESAYHGVTAAYRQAHALDDEAQLAELEGYAERISKPASKTDAPPIRFSHLRAYGKSAADGRLARIQDMESTYAMERGTAVHAILFNTRKVVGYTGKVRNGKNYDAFVADHPDCEILTATEYAKSLAIAASVRASKLAMGVLEGEFEKTIFFDWYGRKCRATPDVRGNGYVTELKTAATTHPERFPWHSLRFAYHAQLRMQLIACGDCADAYVVAVESSGAFNVTVFKVTPAALLDGEKLLCLWIERLITCEASDHYPPYCESIVPLDVPRADDLEYSDEPEEEPLPPLEL